MAPHLVRELDDLPYAAALRRHSGGLAADAEYDAALFEDLVLEQADARNAIFLECAFSRVTVQGGSLRRARLSDSWLRETRLLSADLAQASLLDVTWLDGVVAGAEAFGSTLRRVSFHGCKLDSVNFREATLTQVRFDDCLLRAVDFSGARLTRTVFAGSQLTKVSFSKASMDEVDLRGCELDIVAGPDSLRGAIIDSGQLAGIARALAEGLGITVDDG